MKRILIMLITAGVITACVPSEQITELPPTCPKWVSCTDTPIVAEPIEEREVDRPQDPPSDDKDNKGHGNGDEGDCSGSGCDDPDNPGEGRH